MNNLNNIIIFAFRYGLYRNTGAPLMISNFIKKNIKVLTTQDIDEIINDIGSEYLDFDMAEEWVELRDWLLDYLYREAKNDSER